MKKSNHSAARSMLSALALLAIVWPSTGLSEWVLDELTYHSYCPPAAIRSGLCAAGEDFDASEYLTRSRELGAFVTQRIIFEDGNALSASEIRVPYVVRGRTRFAKYLLFGRESATPCDLATDGFCEIELRRDFWEPASIPENGVYRDATMVFRNSECN